MASQIDPGVRIPAELHEILKRMAAQNRRSINAEVVYALETYVQPFLEYEERKQSLVQKLAAAGPAARVVNQPVTFRGGHLDGRQYHLDVAPEVYSCLVPNTQTIAFWRLDEATHSYNYVGQK